MKAIKALKAIGVSIIAICVIACTLYVLIMATVQQSYRANPPTAEEIAEYPELARYAHE